MQRAPDPPRPRQTGPGLAKARPRLLQQRTVCLVRLLDGEVARAFERADVVSEGEVRTEREGLVYYGSTSLVLDRAAFAPGPSLEVLARALGGDAHARLRAVRIACREAHVRAGASPRTTEAELRVLASPRGIAFELDVVVRLGARSRRAW